MPLGQIFKGIQMTNEEILKAYLAAYKTANDPSCCSEPEQKKEEKKPEKYPKTKAFLKGAKKGIGMTPVVMKRGIKAVNRKVFGSK